MVEGAKSHILAARSNGRFMVFLLLPFTRAGVLAFTLLLLTSVIASGAMKANPPPEIAWSAPIEVARGSAVKGTWQQNESDFRYVDDPTVAMDADGNVTVAWVDQVKKDVLLQRFDAHGKALFQRPVNVSRSPAVFSWLPRLARGPEKPEEVFVLWQEIVFSGGSHGGEIFFARSDDGGETFGEPLNLSKSLGGDGKGRINEQVWHNGSHDLLMDQHGNLSVAWTEYDGPLWFCRSNDGGRSFSKPVRISGDPALPARAPSLAAAPNGALYLAWTVGEDDAADVRIVTSSDRGETFGAQEIVASTPGYSDAPKAAVDAAGTLHVVFAEHAGGPFAPAQVWSARRLTGASGFEAARVISTPAPEGQRAAAFPSIAIDGSGCVHVVWELYPRRSDEPRGLGYTISVDGGHSFQRPALVPNSADAAGFNGSMQGRLMKKLAVNAAGTIAVVNSSFHPGERSRVWLIRAKTR